MRLKNFFIFLDTACRKRDRKIAKEKTDEFSVIWCKEESPVFVIEFF